jgi:hypothetical protein
VLERIVDERQEAQLPATPSGRFGDGGEDVPYVRADAALG